MGRFISEDSLLGTPADPPSRHLYAYAEGEPIGRWDPDGMFWYKVRAGDTLGVLAARYLRGTSDWRWIFNVNRRRIADWDVVKAGWCIWIPNVSKPFRPNGCDWGKAITRITDGRAIKAASALGVDLRTLTYPRLLTLTKRLTGRGYAPTGQNAINQQSLNGIAAGLILTAKGTRAGVRGGMVFVSGNSIFPPDGAAATTVGNTVFLDLAAFINDDPLTAHEYIHVLQGDTQGLALWAGYAQELRHTGGYDPANPYESLGYLWAGYIQAYGNRALGSSTYGDNQPWCSFTPVKSGWNYCP